MNLAVETPWVLSALLLVVLPAWKTGIKTNAYPWLQLLPVDPVSLVVAGIIRLLGMLTLIALVLGLAGLYLKEQRIEQIGKGSDTVILFDRSSSMDNSFAGKTPSGKEESKTTAARWLLMDFINHRPQDRVGVVAYSTSALFVMPLTENKAAIQAAIKAIATPALAFTNISKGLAMALSYFDDAPIAGSRIVLLVSDGAAAIDPDTELALRKQFKQQNIHLYWLFLRTTNSPGIFEAADDPRNNNPEAMPERFLHLFFSNLNIPYQAYEAENPTAMKQAINDINQLENQPLHYFQRLPKQDLSATCYLVATGLLALLLGLKFCEVRCT